jgi:hypothetical protein
MFDLVGLCLGFLNAEQTNEALEVSERRPT